MPYKTEQELFWEWIRKKWAYFFWVICLLALWVAVFFGIYAIWTGVDIANILITLVILFFVSFLHCFILIHD